jgi:hypothetical protein
MSSMVIYEQQASYARGASRPERSSFSADARRFVLRADHYCLWTESWIGIRNHRFFLLMTAYAGLYMLTTVVLRIYWVVTIVRANRGFEWLWLVSGLATLAVIGSGGFSLYQFWHAIRNLIVGITIVERYHKKEVKQARECLKNFEEVCGSRWFCICWIFPCCMCFKPLEDGFYQCREQTP